MKNYIEISLLDSAKINSFILWQKLFTQIHLGLVAIQDAQKKSPIGISFPEYHIGSKFGCLGSKLRLFAKNEAILQEFDAEKQFSRLFDYVHLTSVSQVPEKLDGYAIYSRYQPKLNGLSLLKRHQNRQEKWQEIIKNPNSSQQEILQAKENINKSKERKINYEKENKIKEPFIRLKSLSNNGREFCLFIKKTEAKQSNCQKFTTYGLSNFDSQKNNHNLFSTVPEF